MKLYITKYFETIQIIYESYSAIKQSQWLELPLESQQICKIEKKYLEIVVNMLLSSRGAYKSNFNGKRSKKFNLLIVTNEEKKTLHNNLEFTKTFTETGWKK